MVATVSGLPPHLRLAMGLLTVGLLGFFGLLFREDRPLLGYVLIGFCALRFVLWAREVYYFLTPGPDEGE